MVFQSYALFPHLDVAENIVFGLKVRKVQPAERAARLGRVAALLGLEGLLARKPSQLSGGQQQRVALGRAIISECPVCLMDEPLSNLDAQLRGEMRREIRALQRRLGITMVYVTHDQTGSHDHGRSRGPHAKRAHRAGRPPRRALNPAGDRVRRGLHRGAADEPHEAERERQRSRACGPRTCASRADGLAARVETVEYLGADSLISASAGGQAILCASTAARAVGAGDNVHIAWQREHEHQFDLTTGGRKQ
jgi:sn-glycerol 3-phosphate transport system ATP-binding protein